MADSVTIDSLATELANALSDYSEAVTEDVMKAIDEESNAAVREFRASFP